MVQEKSREEVFQETKEVKLKINSQVDRENMVVALANAGYQVKVKEDYDLIRGTDYYVCFLAP